MKRITNQEAEYVSLAMNTLSWISCARSPLSTLQLRHALAIEIGESELDEENLPNIETVISACAGLVTFDEQSNVIRLIHSPPDKRGYTALHQAAFNGHYETSRLLIESGADVKAVTNSGDSVLVRAAAHK